MRIFLSFFLLLVVTNSSYGQRSLFLEKDPFAPEIKRGARTFRMNKFAVHDVMYVKHTERGDSLCDEYTESLMYSRDTLLIKICDNSWSGCSDTLVSKGEQFVVLNNGYWQKIPVSRLQKIKSKRQPLAAITVGVAIGGYAAFLGGLVTCLAVKNENAKYTALQVALVGDVSFLASWFANVVFAKKRFKFNHHQTINKYWISI